MKFLPPKTQTLLIESWQDAWSSQGTNQSEVGSTQMIPKVLTGSSQASIAPLKFPTLFSIFIWTVVFSFTEHKS